MKSTLIAAILLICALSAVASPQNSIGETFIPKGARLFISPVEGGYDIYLAAAMVKKKVPLVLVTDKTMADFELSSVTESEKAGWAKMLFLGSSSSAEQASIKIVNLKTGTIVFGYNVNKSNSVRGKQSSSESCAKHIKEKMEKESR